ncbi:hypothetical protein ACWIVU_10915 [Ursidibacter arcticus]
MRFLTRTAKLALLRLTSSRNRKNVGDIILKKPLVTGAKRSIAMSVLSLAFHDN